MHVLCNIHHALAPNGIVVDTQPVSARPRVESEGVELGSLDMCEWLDTIHSVDELIGDTVAGGLYELQREQRVVVTDTFDNGRECLELVSGWRGTHVPSGVSKRLTAATSRVTVQQEVRVRLLGRRD